MLGTGHALVTRCYNTTFVLEDQNKYFLVDCGGGNTILKQLKLARINLFNIHDVFITHTHLDHILGIIWILRILGASKADGREGLYLHIYAHEDAIKTIQELCKLFLPEFAEALNKCVEYILVDLNCNYRIIDHNIEFFDVCSTNIKQLGFVLDLNDGSKVVFCGDEPCHTNNYHYLHKCKWLIHESFCLSSEEYIFKPYQKHHSTVRDVCRLAEDWQVENLILCHTEDKNLKVRRKLYVDEGKSFFSGNIFVPYDLEAINLGWNDSEYSGFVELR